VVIYDVLETHGAAMRLQAIEWFGTIKTADDMYRLAFT
jgi:hypothetical protein